METKARPSEFPEEARATTCVGCQAEITTTYFEVNARPVCPGCRDGVVAAATGGSPARRFRHALARGGAAAIVGAALWMVITRWSGWEIGLVAILVGWMVGCGVRKGAKDRGGWVYQSLAVGLTYLAIVATYVPDVHRSFLESVEEGGAESQPDEASLLDPLAGSEQAAVSPTAAGGPPPWLALTAYCAFLVAFASLVPFLALPENLMGVLIIGFALFEAWRLNKRTPLLVTGPFQVSRPAPSAERAAA